MRDLRDEMRRRAEAVDADAPRIARHAQGSITDQARAQRRGFEIGVAPRQMHAVAVVGDGALCVAPSIV